jgi:ATP-dependent DNA helicase RecQ
MSGCEPEQRALAGRPLARAGVCNPRPPASTASAGRLLEAFDGARAGACRTSAGDAEKARWRQYRRCGRSSRATSAGGPRSCATSATASGAEPQVRAATSAIRRSCPRPGRPPAPRANGSGGPGRPRRRHRGRRRRRTPAVGRTRTVEILRGGRSKVDRQNSYDGLPGYGTFAHLTQDEVLERVDELVEAGTLRSTGGRFPKLDAA